MATETPPALAELTRENMQDHVVRTIYYGRRAQADVVLIRVNGQMAAVKDYQNRGRWYRNTFGWFLTARESRALRQVDGTPGVPRYLGRLDRWACMLEYIPGPTCHEVEVGSLEPEFFDDFWQVVLRLRERGLIHNDLKHDTNIIVGPERKPYLVDFAGSMRHVPRWNVFWRWIYDLYEPDDRKAVIKLKRRHRPELVTAEERAFLEHRGRLERFVRWARRGIKWTAKRLVGGGRGIGNGESGTDRAVR